MSATWARFSNGSSIELANLATSTLLSGIQAQPVVDAVDVVLAEVLVHRQVQFSGACQVGAGDLHDRRTIVRIDAEGIAPDGLTVDDRGDIWVALWGGGALRRYRPDGSLLATVAVPVDRPTSCAFGGPGRSILFVTTARHGLDRASLQRQPDAGRIFRIDGLDASGPACAPYRGQIPPV